MSTWLRVPQTVSKQAHTLLVVMQIFVGTVLSAFGGAWYLNMPLLLLTVWGGGAVEVAVGLGSSDGVSPGWRAAALVLSIVCGAGWLLFVGLSSGHGAEAQCNC